MNSRPLDLLTMAILLLSAIAVAAKYEEKRP